MIRKGIIVLFVLFTVAIMRANAPRDHMKCSVLAIQYIGEADKPITPVVISDSQAGAEWFRETILKRGDLEFTSVHVVSASRMESLISCADAYRNRAKGQFDMVRKSMNTVSVTLVTTQGQSAFPLDIESAARLLDGLKRLCKEDDALCSDLSYFRDRILPMQSW